MKTQKSLSSRNFIVLAMLIQSLVAWDASAFQQPQPYNPNGLVPFTDEIEGLGGGSFNVSVGAQRTDGREYIWCQRTNGSVFRHRVGERRDNGTGPDINTCSDYGNGISELAEAQMGCLDQQRTYSFTAQQFSSNPCANGTVTDADNDNDETPQVVLVNCKKEDGTFQQHPQGTPVAGCTPVTDTTLNACLNAAFSAGISDQAQISQGCAQQITAAYPPAITPGNTGTGTGTTPQPGVVQAGTLLDNIACSDLTRDTGSAVQRDATSSFTLQFTQSPFGDAGQVMGQSQGSSRDSSERRSRRRSRSNFDPENFDGSDLDDTDFDGGDAVLSSSHRDFMEAPLLTYCESQGTDSWSKFSDQLGKSGGTEFWDASWARTFRKTLGLDGAADYLAAGIGYDDKEKAFIKSCQPAKIKELLTYSGPNDALKELSGKLKKSLKKGVEKFAVHRRNLEKCEALAHLTKESDYDREYETGNRTSKTTKASFDGKIKCETYGPEAQDFKKCSDFINLYDGSMVAKTALNSGQQIHYQGQSMDRQAELARQGSTGGIDHRGALGSQREDIKDRAGYATQNAALDSAKLAGLFGILQSMPKKDDLVKTCSSDLRRANALGRLDAGHDKALSAFLSGFGIAKTEVGANWPTEDGEPRYGYEDLLPSQKFSTETRSSGGICHVTAHHDSASTLVMNQAMRSIAKQILAQTAIEAAASFAAAGMLNKQAKQIDDLLKRIEGYDPSEDFVAPTADLMAGPCAFDPTQEGCSGEFSGSDRAVGFGDTSLSFSAGGFGSSGTQLGVDDGYDNATGSGNGGADRSDASTTVGSIIPSVDKKSGFQDPAAAAARAKAGQAPRGGGGGGGASAIGSTGGGGGGGSTGQARGGQANGGKQLAYAGSSIGRLSGGRGVGRKPASKDGAANPFANMFKKGGPANETLNFRGPAGIGGKSGNIFDQISSRYQVVQTKNRLLEYEEKK